MIRKQVFHVIGYLLIMLGLSMTFSAGWSLYYVEGDLISIVKAQLLTIAFGIILILFFKNKKGIELTTRDGFAIVGLGWLTMAIFSALPFYFSGKLNYVNSFFEAVSGLTTTGATILGHHSTHMIEDLPHGLLFWRSFTQFIGGMGIIVFSIAILPMLGMGGVQLFRAEIAGPTKNKLTPRVRQTAKLLWGIYVGFVLLLSLILKIEGMTWYDAFCHSFTTIATAGFSTQNASIGSYDSLIQWTIILFMFIAGTNFSLHYYLISKGKFEYFKDQEFRYYIAVCLMFSLLFFINLISSNMYDFNHATFRHSVFTATSLLTTTGFSTENFNDWPAFSNMIVFVLLFIGGSAGSTTGALKIIRTIVIFKFLVFEVKKLIHSKGVFNISLGKKVVDDDVVKATLGFYMFYIFIFIITALLLSITDLDFITALSASAASIGNIGPGLGEIGPANSWGGLNNFAKFLTSFCMILGRLEIFTIMVLFSRSFWKR